MGGFAWFSAKFPAREQGIFHARAGSGTDQSANFDIGSTVLKSRIRGILLSNEYGDFSVALRCADDSRRGYSGDTPTLPSPQAGEGWFAEWAEQRDAHAVVLTGHNGAGRKSPRPAGLIHRTAHSAILPLCSSAPHFLRYCDSCFGSSNDGFCGAQSIQRSRQSRTNCSARPLVPLQSWLNLSFVP